MRWLMKENLQVVSTGSLAEDICSSMKKLKVLKSQQTQKHGCKHSPPPTLTQENDVRIIIGYFEEDFADEVFCCVSSK